MNEPIAQNLAAANDQHHAHLWATWPLFALLGVEVLAIIFFAPPGAGEITPVWLAAAVALLLVGIVPALKRPSVAANLVGCSAIVLASVFWRMPNALASITTFDQLALASETNAVKLGLLNIVLLAPLTLHLAAVFPQRNTLKLHTIIGYYALIIGIALVAFALPVSSRQPTLIVLLLATYAGFGVAGYQFFRTIQVVQPLQPRAAQQARLLLLTLAIAQAPFLLLPVSSFVRLLIPYQGAIAAQILLPIGLAYVITRNDVFGIDAALRRALDYALVSFGLLVIYFGLTALLTQLSGSVGGTWGFAATVLSVVAAAAAFTPLRRVTQQFIDQAFYPERLRFDQTISAARATLSRVVEREAVIHLLKHELPQQLGASWAKLILRPSFEQPAEAPQPHVWSALMTVGGRPIGAYWLGPRHSGLPYATDEQAQLEGLLQQASLALAYAETFDSLVQLNNELEERVAIRTEHVVAQQRELAALEERQHLARDLHDSVKQTLFSLGIGLRTARSRVRSEPEAAIQLLEQQEQIAVQAQAEMGGLLVQLRTPATGTTDLVVVLAQHIAWFTHQHGLAITHAMPLSLVLPEPLPRELAQVAKEALHNVVRHSGTTSVELNLQTDQGQITLAITDYGYGFDSRLPHQTYGLRSMRERMALLGGTLRIRTAPGEGTSIWAQVPVKP